MNGVSGFSIRLKEAMHQHSTRVLIADDCGAWTGSELELRMAPLIKILENHTLPGSRVGICFPNWGVQAFAILATIVGGRVPVILSHTDVVNNPNQWLKQTHLSLLISSEELCIAEMHRLPLIGLDRDLNIKINNLKNQTSSRLHDIVYRPPAGTALMLYTSGSVGVPKGVYVPAAGLLETAEHLIAYFALNEKTVSPVVLPVCHSMALNTQFFPTFLAGGKCYFWNSRLGINRVFRTISGLEGKFVSLIGEVLRTCWEEKARKNLEPVLSVEHVQLAGGMILPQHIQMAKDLFPNAVIHKGYGLTEAIRVTMINHHDPDFNSNIVGRPLGFQQVEVRTPDGKQADANVTGQIFVRGPNVMLGFCGSTVDHLDERGFLATGDLGFFNAKGQLGIIGRTDSIFKINGVRVSGIEIEQIARGLSPLVSDVKSIAVDDVRRMGTKVVLFLEIAADLQEEFFQDHFETFRMDLWDGLRPLPYFPRDIVVLDRFPRTTNGKLQISGLHAQWTSLQQPYAPNEGTVNLKFFRSRNVHIV